jgi:ribosomal protein L6P/L9E
LLTLFSTSEKIKVPKNICLIINNNTLKLSGFMVEFCIRLGTFFSAKISKEGFLILFFSENVGVSAKVLKRFSRFFRLFKPRLRTLKKKIEEVFSGVSVGFSKQLNLLGVGYKCAFFSPFTIVLKLGFSHDIVIYSFTTTATFCPLENLIIIRSFSRIILSSLVIRLQRAKSLDFYKVKGVLFREQLILKKKFKKK